MVRVRDGPVRALGANAPLFRSRSMVQKYPQQYLSKLTTSTPRSWTPARSVWIRKLIECPSVFAADRGVSTCRTLNELGQQGEGSGVRIERRATAANLALIRRDVAEEASRLGMAEGRLADLKTIVSEACTNVVRHAYEDAGSGSVEVELIPKDRNLTVVIRDWGTGICPQPEAVIPSLRMGLPLIGALSYRFRLLSELNVGTVLEVDLPLRA